jgi:hypothetical protein
MVDRKVVPFDEFYYQLKLMHLFQKHPVYLPTQKLELGESGTDCYMGQLVTWILSAEDLL